jgi:polyisoprenoid-binding protein YceI
MTEQATRVVEGTEVPLVGRWVIDSRHSSLAFEARHYVVTRMRGRFRSARGTITIAEHPEDSTVEVLIDAASIDTVHDVADEHLRDEHFLDVANHPEIIFHSTAVRHVDADRWAVTGDLTIRGVTRVVTLDTRFNGALPVERYARAKMGFTATTRIDRRDFGMSYNVPIPTGGFIVGNEVDITLDVEADLPNEPVG